MIRLQPSEVGVMPLKFDLLSDQILARTYPIF